MLVHALPPGIQNFEDYLSMMVLGLHLGHDATACVMSGGHILSVIEKERLVRVKDAGLMNINLIEAAIECAGVDID